MNFMFADSECSSRIRCESGWTLYLDNSYIAPHATYRGNDFIEKNTLLNKHEDEDEDEEDDLSMVSDASSGPPHFHHEDEDEDEDEYCGDNNNGCSFHRNNIHVAFPKKSRNLAERGGKTRRRKIQNEASLLDDTASSPMLHFSSNNSDLIDSQASVPKMLDFSQGYSTTHFQVV